MKKHKVKLIKLLKWSIIIISSYWLLTTLIFGHTNLDSKTGMVSFGWSGFDALFSKNEEFGFLRNEQYKTNLNGIDGPYIFDDFQFSVTDKNLLASKKIARDKPIKVFVNNNDKDQFKVVLKKIHQQEIDSFRMPNKLIAISDIEGNFDALHSFLLNNKVIDKNYNWIFGEGHLVLNGDFFDRGENVTEVLWLIYMLEDKAEKQGGKVHFINGNHEIMNLYGSTSDADRKYIEVAKQISNKNNWDEAMKFLYSEKSELGKWLRTKNVIEKIGKYIFVHAGLNKNHVEASLNIPEINKIARKNYGKNSFERSLSEKEKLILYPQNSPYWIRNLSMSFTYKIMFFLNGTSSHKTTEIELDEVLRFYDAEKIVIGHSVVDNVFSDYNGKVIKIDVKHGLNKNSPKTQGLFIENGIEYKVNGLGEKEILKSI